MCLTPHTLCGQRVVATQRLAAADVSTVRTLLCSFTGNKEDGYLFGIDNLIAILEEMYEDSCLELSNAGAAAATPSADDAAAGDNVT